MWNRKPKVKEAPGLAVEVAIPAAALTCVFDECDQFDIDETGGRVIGTYTERNGKLSIRVQGIIEPGPKARRSQVSFFQDGEHQERVFRQIEKHNPGVEHLGNWHTHHVNGLPHLSGGDISTYTRTVNHKNQNTPFFYALLVIAKNNTSDPLRRYTIKHYLFRRGEKDFIEIAPEQVAIVDEPLIWSAGATGARLAPIASDEGLAVDSRPERVLDRDVLSEFYTGFRPFGSAKLGFYWRGKLELLDGSHPEIVLLEEKAASHPKYTITLRDSAEVLAHAAENLAKQEFSSARMALITAERTLNLALYKSAHLSNRKT